MHARAVRAGRSTASGAASMRLGEKRPYSHLSVSCQPFQFSSYTRLVQAPRCPNAEGTPGVDGGQTDRDQSPCERGRGPMRGVSCRACPSHCNPLRGNLLVGRRVVEAVALVLARAGVALPHRGLPIRTRSILAGVFALPLARPKRGVVAAGLAPGDLVLAASLAVPHRALRARSVRAAGVLPRAALLAHLDRWHRAEHAVASLAHRVPLGLRRRVVLLALPLAGVLIRRRRLQVGLALGLEKGGWQDPNFGAWSDMGPARSSAPCTGLLVRTPRRRR